MKSTLFLLLVFFCLPAQAGHYPVSIEHKFGVTNIPKKPLRVVSVSYIAHDHLLSLGVVPVGLRYWFGGYKYGVWPWAQRALGKASPVVFRGQISIEQVAALKPDLILATLSGITKTQYQRLSGIAPTLADAKGYGDFSMPWQEVLTMLGKALNKTQLVTEKINHYDQRIAQIKAQNPEFLNKTASIVWAASLSAYITGDSRMRFLTQLGFKEANHLDRFVESKNQFSVHLSEEAIEVVDTDVLLWLDPGDNRAHLRNMPLRKTTRAWREGREIYVDKLLGSAMAHASPLSIDYALTRIIPLLQQAIDGDPNTPVSSMQEANLLENK